MPHTAVRSTCRLSLPNLLVWSMEVSHRFFQSAASACAMEDDQHIYQSQSVQGALHPPLLFLKGGKEACQLAHLRYSARSICFEHIFLQTVLPVPIPGPL